MAMAALAANAAAQSYGTYGETGNLGQAKVVNLCTYDVYLADVPAADGGYSEIDQTLTANGGTFTQDYTVLTNLQGWSIKMSKIAGQFGDNIMQYEYAVVRRRQVLEEIAQKLQKLTRIFSTTMEHFGST